MDIKRRLNEITLEHNTIIKKYNDLLKDLNDIDYILENEELKKSVTDYRNSIQELTKQIKKLKDENAGLKTCLSEQILDEKLQIIKISKNHTEVYCQKRTEVLNE